MLIVAIPWRQMFSARYAFAGIFAGIW